MLRYLIFCLAALPYTVMAQNANFIGSWTNGHEFYGSHQLNDSTIRFEGGNLHEGGYGFMIRLKKDQKWYIVEGGEEEIYASLGKNGDWMECKNIDGIRILLIMQGQELIRECLREMKEEETLEKIRFDNKVNYELAGKYVHSRTKKEVIFYAGKKEAQGLTTARKYSIETEYDDPVDVISFDNKQSFYYEVTEEGLNIFNVKAASDDWYKKEKIMTLQKIEWFNFSGNPGLKGRYPFASTLVLIDDILANFTIRQLKIMRNEIFARHGYIFKNVEWSTWFAKQDWYKGELEHVNDRLTELERLNIRLILRMEDKKSRIKQE
jgi:hypothetical protein